ncbi:MAG: YceI family protein [Breznakibacter sp.]
MENATKTKWGIDPTHSEIAFKVKHLMITNVKGVFKEFGATVLTRGNDFSTAEIDVTLNAVSVDTGVADRDAHLKSADFFDVENHKEIRFVATKFEKVDDEDYKLHGNLTIKGITKPVKLDVEYAGTMKDPWGNEKAGFVVNGKINRKDWGLNWNAALETGGVLVSDEVKISSEIQLVKQV